MVRTTTSTRNLDLPRKSGSPLITQHTGQMVSERWILTVERSLGEMT